MKVVILAGGFGTRLAEETDDRPKPMVEIGGRPILWHIMKIYAAAGYNDFVICCGYKGDHIKRYFAEYFLRTSDITVDMRSGDIEYLDVKAEPWRVTLIDTGQSTMTGGRLARVAHLLRGGTFALTYGDGVASIDIGALVDFHRSHGKQATITAVPSPGRFGILQMRDSSTVESFSEKPHNEMGWINGGFFILEPPVLDIIAGDATIWERDPLMKLAASGELEAFRHQGFWQPMDTLRDKRELEALWQSGEAPWKRW